jgi:hypothetical protein
VWTSELVWSDAWGKTLCLSRGSNFGRPLCSEALYWLNYPSSSFLGTVEKKHCEINFFLGKRFCIPVHYEYTVYNVFVVIRRWPQCALLSTNMTCAICRLLLLNHQFVIRQTVRLHGRRFRLSMSLDTHIDTETAHNHTCPERN